MKKSELKEMILKALEEKKLTAAEKRKKEQIVKGMKKTFKGDKSSMYAIATAKAKKIAEAQQIATTYQFTPEQYKVLIKFGTKESMDGNTLYIDPKIYQDLDKTKSSSNFKQEFYATVEPGRENLASQVLTGMKKSLNPGNTATIGGKKYFILKGHMTKSGNFNFENPYRKK